MLIFNVYVVLLAVAYATWLYGRSGAIDERTA
jgi:hypothetical protein